jgi:hypothetical protein
VWCGVLQYLGSRNLNEMVGSEWCSRSRLADAELPEENVRVVLTPTPTRGSGWLNNFAGARSWCSLIGVVWVLVLSGSMI